MASEVLSRTTTNHGSEEETLLKQLPPGFRFHPSDEDIISHYLKALSSSFSCPVIAVVDFNKIEPWDKEVIFRDDSALVGMRRALGLYTGRAPIEHHQTGVDVSTGDKSIAAEDGRHGDGDQDEPGQFRCPRIVIPPARRYLLMELWKNQWDSAHDDEGLNWDTPKEEDSVHCSVGALKPSIRKSYLSIKVDNQLEAKHKPVLSFAYANKGNLARKNIFIISSAGNGRSSSHSEGTHSTLTGGNNHHRETIVSYDYMPEVILDNQAQVNCTGIFNVLSNLNIGPENVVLIAANGGEMETLMSGSVHTGNFILPDVYYSPDLGNRIIVSGSILDNLGYGYECGQGKCTVKDLKDGRTVGEGRLVNGNYILDYLKVTRDRPRASEQPGLVTMVWNKISSALRRLGLNPQGPPM